MASDADAAETDRPLELSRRDHHRVLADPQRRMALYVLSKGSPPFELASLAKAIAERNPDADPDSAPLCPDARAERIREITVALHHNHLPMLASLGLIVYDASANRVEAVAGTVATSQGRSVGDSSP